MYGSELHSILVRSLERSKWTRSTRDEDNFRQVICSHLYEDISPNNTEIPSTRSGGGDIQIFGRKIELKYVNTAKRDKLDSVLADFDLLLESKVEFCIVALRFDADNKESHLARTIELPLLSARKASVPIAHHLPHGYYGPGIFLPACYVHAIQRVSVISKKTNSYISIERAHNIERSSFISIGAHCIHVDVIGSKEDGLLTFLYTRADDVALEVIGKGQDIVVPYNPSPIRVAEHERVNVLTKPGLLGRKVSLIESDVPNLKI